jgi:hypothetical protein
LISAFHFAPRKQPAMLRVEVAQLFSGCLISIWWATNHRPVEQIFGTFAFLYYNILISSPLTTNFLIRLQ